MHLVIHPPVDDTRLAAIRSAAGDGPITNARDEDEAQAAMASADAFFGKLTPRLLASGPGLRWVQAPTAGLEHYLFRELVEHPAALTNMRGIHAEPIADQVMGYVICFARNLHLYARRQVEHRWDPVGGEEERSDFISGPGSIGAMDRATVDLQASTLGIVGLGAIGRQVARRAKAFGLRVVATDARTSDPPSEVDILWTESGLDELLATSQFVVICLPHTPKTAHLFDRRRLRRMGRAAYLINVGRGAVVELDALVDALREGTIAGAALDVFEVEPLPPEHPLWELENLIITPHVAGYATSVAANHLGVLVENVRRFRAGEPLLNLVDKRAWY